MINRVIRGRLDTLESRLRMDNVTPDGLSASLWELSEALQGMTAKELNAQAESMGVRSEDVQSIEMQYRPRIKRWKQ